MNSRVLEPIPFRIDEEQLRQKLRIKDRSDYISKLQRLVDEAQAIGKPKALYRAVFIESKMDDRVVINGTVFTSRVLRVNLDKVYRVFPFVATCGVELETWSSSTQDMLQKYWVDMIKEAALRMAIEYLEKHLIEKYRLVKISRMNPGSLPDWPLSEQQPLFAILGKGTESIGVQLTDHCLMIPIKSVSGIWFPTEESFESCRLCPREQCPGRRTPYDQGLYDRKYGKVKE
jgi:hypothetical protein